MTPAQLDAMQAAAQARIREFVNRSAAQHMRALRERRWRKAAS